MGAVVALDAGWEMARGSTNEWLPARVPGTVAGALVAAGRWRPGEPDDIDEHDWVFRTRFDAPGAAKSARAVLRLDGVATHAVVALNGVDLLHTESMFVPYEAAVAGVLREHDNELTITCHALAPLLAVPRRPRARWRTRLADNALRWHRTMLLGRTPGMAPSPAAAGPWRPVWLDRRLSAPPAPVLTTRFDGADGVLSVAVSGPVEVELAGPSGTHGAALPAGGGELRVPGVARWWPHTHGEPVLHSVTIGDDGGGASEHRVGFRSVKSHPEAFGLVVNGVPVFARGAVWTPVDPIGLAPDVEALRATLEQARDAGMNVLRVVGTSAYEQPAFHDLCDEIGILVWQDMMFANFDYPVGDPDFRALVESEARAVLGELARHPSTAVVCGNSEVEQQVAMLGLDPALGRGELFGDLLPALVAEHGVGALYVPSAPSGGALPFRFETGVAHYFGVGGYRRPITDARRAEVRFAAECLAFSNVGDEDDGRTGVPSDNGVDWTFADVRDHYVRERYEIDPAGLLAADPERYAALGRMATGEVMAEVFGEWRRAGSPCQGGIVLWLRDLAPGSGWGVVDAHGRPKAAWHHLRRALAPRAVWMTDEGLAGVRVHVANDGPDPLVGRLRLALYARSEHRMGEALEEFELGPRGAAERDAEALLGRFADVSWAYRFGPPPNDAIVASLEASDGSLLSQAFLFPAGPPLTPETPEALGLEAERSDGAVRLCTRRLVYGVRIGGGDASDDAFSLEPGRERRVTLGDPGTPVTLTALNLDRSLAV